MPIYTASSTTWPVLQTLDEVKHPSGLFTATATYIRPTGNTAIPSTIPTSIGDLILWPVQPTVSKDTSGFERLTATAYGVWDDNAQEIIYNYDIFEISATARVFNRCHTNDYYVGDKLELGCVSYGCGEFMYDRVGTITGNPVSVLLESCFIRTVKSVVPSASISAYSINKVKLEILSPSFLNITAPGGRVYQSQVYPVAPFTKFLSSFKENKYGSIIETEVVWSLKGPNVVEVGAFYEAEYDLCTPPLPPSAP